MCSQATRTLGVSSGVGKRRINRVRLEKVMVQERELNPPGNWFAPSGSNQSSSGGNEARRVIPMTPRVRAVLESRWDGAGKPQEGWEWPASTRSGHVEPSSLRKHHARAFETMAEEAAKRNEKPTRPFMLYSLRQTFLTRLGQSGCDVWTLARIAGHLHCNFVPLRSPLGGRCSRRDFSAGRSQNWAQRDAPAQLPVAKNAINAVQ